VKTGINKETRVYKSLWRNQTSELNSKSSECKALFTSLPFLLNSFDHLIERRKTKQSKKQKIRNANVAVKKQCMKNWYCWDDHKQFCRLRTRGSFKTVDSMDFFLFAATVYYYIIYVHKMRKLKHGLDLFKNNKTNIYKNKLNKRHSEWK
jgi:hypothetical protein